MSATITTTVPATATTTATTKEQDQKTLSPRLAIDRQKYAGLDSEWVEMWDTHGASMTRADEVTIEEYRRNPAQYSFTYPTCAGPDVYHVEDRKIPVTAPAGEITIRIYTPEGVGPFPAHLNMHGGGWVLGGLQTEAAWCRHTTNSARIKVIDIDYRLAPEHRFPTAIYDCWDAVKWVRAHAAELDIDAGSISIGGLSAGGHMAGVLAHFARDEGVELKLHMMVVPATDMRYCLKDLELRDAGCVYESVLKYHDAPWGPLGREKWFVKYWLGDDVDAQKKALDSWICTPVLAPSFENLSPAHIITAEFDLERDEGEYYGELLRQAGNQVSVKRYMGMPHAFGHYNHPERGLKASFEYIQDTSRVLRRAHYGEEV